MTENPAGTVTRLLAQVSAGEHDRIDDLWSLVYEQLHEIAQVPPAGQARRRNTALEVFPHA